MVANEQVSRVDVVHGCFSKGGDSTLSVFSWEPFQRSCKTTNEFLWLAS